MTLRTPARAIYAFLAVSVLAPGAPTPSGQEILTRVGDVYAHAKSIHIVAKRDETWSKAGQLAAERTTELEIALRGSRNYFARVKSNGQESIAMSDGEHTWKAVPSTKQWMQVDAAVLDARDAEGPDPRAAICIARSP